MVVVPLTKPSSEVSEAPRTMNTNGTDWVRYAAAGALVASGALLLTGQRRAGLIAGVSGAALAMLDQSDAVYGWWKRLPTFFEELQGTLDRAQCAVQDLSAQGQKLRQALGK